MSLSARFVLLITVLVTLVFAVAGSGARALSTVDHALDETLEVDVHRLLVVTEIRKLFRSQVVAERDYMLETDPSARAAQRTKIAGLRADTEAAFKEAESLLLADDQAPLAELRAAHTRFVARTDAVMDAVDRGDLPAARTHADEHRADPVSWEAVIKAVVARSEAQLDDRKEQNARTYEGALTILAGVTVSATLIGVLAGLAIFRGIRRNVEAVVSVNHNLERLVAERTAALAAREQAIQRVLDATGEGLLTVDLNGVVQAERSRAIAAWFPDAPPNTHLWDLLLPPDSTKHAMFQIAFEQLAQDVLPFEIAASLLPPVLHRGATAFELKVREVREDGRFTKVLVILRDVTRELGHARSEAEAREQHAIIQRILTDREGFRSCVAECERLLAEIVAESDPIALRRHVHTLRGNAAVYGFASVAQAAEQLETSMSTEGVAEPDDIVLLQQSWRNRLSQIQDWFVPDAPRVIEVYEGELNALVMGLRTRKDYDEMVQLAESWAWSSSAEQLGRLKAQALRLAERVGKTIEVEVEPNGLRLAPETLDRFWPSLVHVLRNAVDHGIEHPDARVALGKPPVGRLRFSTRLDAAGVFTVCLADDGAGIDRAALCGAARARGIPLAQPEDWVDALFTSGVTTAEAPGELSGRGVGMDAVRAACLDAGGTVEVWSEANQGTRLTFRFAALAVRRTVMPELVLVA